MRPAIRCCSRQPSKARPPPRPSPRCARPSRATSPCSAPSRAPSACLLPLVEAARLHAVPTLLHVAPAAGAVLRRVEEEPQAVVGVAHAHALALGTSDELDGGAHHLRQGGV